MNQNDAENKCGESSQFHRANHDHTCCSESWTNPSVHQTLDELAFERGIWNAALSGDIEDLNQKLERSNGSCVNDVDNSGYTALHYACRSGHLEICKTLLLYGASVNVATSSGKATPLHRTAYMNHSDVLSLLLDHGANSLAVDSDGMTPLHKASDRGHIKCIEILIKNNPKALSFEDNKHRKPEDLLKSTELQEWTMNCKESSTVLTKEDCTCHICMDIMVEPVTMPCGHSVCMPCFRMVLEKSNLDCPICRTRISSWARRATKNTMLVDKLKWEAIKAAFPNKVKDRLDGKEVSDEDEETSFGDFETQLRRLKDLSQPGEIRQEYEAALLKLHQQREEEANEEEKASAALIQALQREEQLHTEQANIQKKEMEMMDRKAAEQLQQMSTPRLDTSTTSGGATVPLTKHTKGSRNGKISSWKGKHMSTPTSPNLTLNSFFSTVGRMCTSAPPKTDSTSGFVNNAKSNLSPYPYSCISPEDKIFYGLSYLDSKDSDSMNSDKAPCMLEHSSVSSTKTDLNCNNTDKLSAPRTDIDMIDLSKMNTQLIDIFAPGPSGISSSSQQQFQPISTSLRTSPPPLASRLLHNPVAIRLLPRQQLGDFNCNVSISPASNCRESCAGSSGNGQPDSQKTSPCGKQNNLLCVSPVKSQSVFESGKSSVECMVTTDNTGSSESEMKKRKHSDCSEGDGDAACSVHIPVTDQGGGDMLLQEERDCLLAQQLQNMYAMLDRRRITQDRFQGASNEYSLRRTKRQKK